MKQVIITALLFLAAFEVGAKGQDPPKPWQWLECNNRIPFLQYPQTPRATKIDNIPAYMQSLVYNFADDTYDIFYKDNGKKVVAVKKKDYDRYYLTKYGQDFEVKMSGSKVWHPTIKDKSEETIDAVWFISKVPIADTTKVADLVYQYLNDIYNLKTLLLNLTFGNKLSDAKAQRETEYGVGTWYGLQSGMLKLKVSPDGKMSNYMEHFRPALDRSLALPNFAFSIIAYQADYAYGLDITVDKSGKFFEFEYSISCIYFHRIRYEDRWEPYVADQKAFYKTLLDGEKMVKKSHAMYPVKPVAIPITKLLTR